MKKIISIAIFLTSVFILAYSSACFAISDNDSVYYLDSSKENTIEIWTEDQPWWDLSWKQRQQITISGSVRELTDYQTKIELNSENVGKNWNWFNKGADIRFTDDMNRKINFYIESWSDVRKTAKIWVKAPSIPLAGTTIYMYYKNPSVVSESNGRATFVFFDDFDRLKNWNHFALDSENVIGSTIYDTTKAVSKPYSLRTELDLGKKNSVTEGAESPAINLAQTNDELIVDMKYRTWGTIWDDNKKNVSLRVSNFPIKFIDSVNTLLTFDNPIKWLPNSNNRWINASSAPFTALEQTYYYLRLNIDGVSTNLTNVNLDDIRIRKYIEQEPVVEISNWYGSPEKKIIALEGTSQIGMLFNIGEEFEQMEQKNLEIEEIKREELKQEELKALEEERRKRQEGFQMQETTPETSTRLHIIDKQTLGYTIGGNIRALVNTSTVNIFGNFIGTSRPAQKAINTAVSARRGSATARTVATTASASAKANVIKAGLSLMSAVKAVQSGDLSTAIKNVNVAAKAIAKAQHEVKITKTAVEIENRFTDISTSATNIASHEISRQISSGGYSQSFTRQEIQSAVSRAIAQSQDGQVGEIILQKGVETEQGGLVREIFQVTVVKSVEQELNIVIPQEILDDTLSTPFFNVSHIRGFAKPESMSDKAISEIDDPNLFIQVGEGEGENAGMTAITIDKVLKGGALYHYEKIPIVIESHTGEGEKILVIKIGEATKQGTAITKTQIAISGAREGTIIGIDYFPATDLYGHSPIVYSLLTMKDYTSIGLDYIMDYDERKKLIEAWEFNQGDAGDAAREALGKEDTGFDKYTYKRIDNYNEHKNAKQNAIDNGLIILDETITVDDQGKLLKVSFTAGIAKQEDNGSIKTELMKVETEVVSGDVSKINTGLEYDAQNNEVLEIDLKGMTLDTGNFNYDVLSVNKDLFKQAEIVGDKLILHPTDPKTYGENYSGTDRIDILITDNDTNKTFSNVIFVNKAQDSGGDYKNITGLLSGNETYDFYDIGCSEVVKEVRDGLIENGCHNKEDILLVTHASEDDVDNFFNNLNNDVKQAKTENKKEITVRIWIDSHGGLIDEDGKITNKTDEAVGGAIALCLGDDCNSLTASNFLDSALTDEEIAQGISSLLDNGADTVIFGTSVCYGKTIVEYVGEHLSDEELDQVVLCSVGGETVTYQGIVEKTLKNLVGVDGGDLQKWADENPGAYIVHIPENTEHTGWNMFVSKDIYVDEHIDEQP